MAFETLRLDIEDGIARITLDRPDAANAIDLQMSRELMAATIECDEDAEVRAVLIGGRGKAFCAGGDLRGFATAGDRVPALLKEMTTHLHAALSRLARMRAPVVAAINGVAAGAGFSLACAADLALAAESARFTMAYTRAGLTPDGSSTYHLPRLCGSRRSLELLLTNRMLSAHEALEWGLVNRVVADERLAEEALSVVRALAAGPSAAFAATKRLVLDSGSQSLETQMELESRAIADAARSDDGREGIQAFLEKRAPSFKGC